MPTYLLASKENVLLERPKPGTHATFVYIASKEHVQCLDCGAECGGTMTSWVTDEEYRKLDYTKDSKAHFSIQDWMNRHYRQKNPVVLSLEISDESPPAALATASAPDDYSQESCVSKD